MAAKGGNVPISNKRGKSHAGSRLNIMTNKQDNKVLSN